jgi:murein DD-endopeptidase MepM/ murein hydrolase activator NlpD
MPAAILPTRRGPSAFLLRDAEGAPDQFGRKFHAAVDWFAPGGTVVRSPCDGEVVEIRPSRGTSGQVFGGTVKIREAGSGRIYVCRHVDPTTGFGVRVRTNMPVAHVTAWRDGPSHVHLEVWRQLYVPGRTSGYYVPNMLDPGLLNWGPYNEAAVEPDEPDPPKGETLRLSLRGATYAGWAECEPRLRWIAVHGLEPASRPAIAWNKRVWRGPRPVTNVAKHLVAKYL